MTEKFSVKVYQGDRVRVLVTGCMSIRRIYCWSKLLSKYVDPKRGGKYEARRSRGLNQEREMRYFDSLQDAREWQVGRNFKQIQDSDPSPEKREGYCLEDLLNDWQRLAWPNLSEGTRVSYSHRVVQLHPLFGIRVEDLTPRVIDEWLALLKTPPFQKRYKKNRFTFEKELKILKAMVNWYIETNDDSKLMSPFKKRHIAMSVIREKPVSTPKYMTPDELENWLEKLKSISKIYWALAITQQKQVLRISEAAAMKWSNLNLKNRVYRVTEHAVWMRFKGQGPMLRGGTKTNRAGEAFNIHLRSEVVEVLTELQSKRGGDLIFTVDGELLTYRQIQYVYNKAFKLAGLPYSSTHILRHSGATEFLDETGDPLALQQMGNWKDMKTALHYGKILSSRARDAIQLSENRKRLRLIKSEDEETAM